MTPLAKKLGDSTMQSLSQGNAPHGPTVVRAQDETGWTPEALRPAAAALEQHLADPAEHRAQDLRASGMATKHVLKVGNDRWLLKPYHEPIWPGDGTSFGAKGPPTSGWAERTHQALYHAGGIGHLHQQVHVVNAKHQGQDEPLLAIRMAPEYHPLANHTFHPGDTKSDLTQTGQDINKIGVMDWLGSMGDRHMNNLMVNPQHQLLAIDHGLALGYHPSVTWNENMSVNDHLGPNMMGALHVVKGATGHSPKDARATMDWWRQSSPAIRAAFAKRLEMVKHFALRHHLRTNFEARAAHLDRAATDGDVGAFWNGRIKHIPTPGIPE